jgi:hypothetical protein
LLWFYSNQRATAHHKEIRLARTANLEKLLEGLLTRIGRAVAGEVVTRLDRSELSRRVERLARRAAQKPARGGGHRRRKKAVKCQARCCRKSARAKGLCSMHYQRARYASLNKKNPARKKAIKREANPAAKKAAKSG